MPVEIALFQPQIPQNTGNIGRLCVGFGVKLSLIEPLGFQITDRQLKRAGLDYWKFLQFESYKNFDDFYRDKSKRVIVISKFASVEADLFRFEEGDRLIMGNEISGFPKELIDTWSLPRVKIPMTENIRSYNLANATAMILYEAYRQIKW